MAERFRQDGMSRKIIPIDREVRLKGIGGVPFGVETRNHGSPPSRHLSDSDVKNHRILSFEIA
jgi:hypothetical protein